MTTAQDVDGVAVSVSGLTGNDTVPTMDNTIYKLFSLLVLPCLSDLVLLIQHITIFTSTVHTTIRTDTPTRLPEDITNEVVTERFHFLVNKVLSTNIYIFSPFYSLPLCAVIIQFTLLFKYLSI